MTISSKLMEVHEQMDFDLKRLQEIQEVMAVHMRLAYEYLEE